MPVSNASKINDERSEYMEDDFDEVVPIGKKNNAKILLDIIKREGGTMRELDGTVSHRGFNEKLVSNYYKERGLPTKSPTELTFGDSLEIFEEEILGRNGINRIKDAELLPLLADFAFNSGPDDAARELQRVVGATTDGIIGPKTIKKINEYVSENGPKSLYDNYINARLDFLRRSESPSVKRYLKGLEGRVESFRQ